MSTKWTPERKAKFRATVAAKQSAKEHGHGVKTHRLSPDTHRAFIINLLQHAEREITNENMSKAQTYATLALDEMRGSSSEGS